MDVQLYKALGERRVKLPLNNKDYWAKIETAEKLASGAESMELGFMGWKAYKMRLNSIGYPLQLFLPPLGSRTLAIVAAISLSDCGLGN